MKISLLGHLFDPRSDNCLKCGVSYKICNNYACLNNKGGPSNEFLAFNERAENTDEPHPRSVYERRGRGNSGGRGNNLKSSIFKTPDLSVASELPKNQASLPQSSHENMNREKVNRRGRGRGQRQDDQCQVNRRHDHDKSMKAFDPSLYYTPVFHGPTPAYSVIRSPPSSNVSVLQGLSKLCPDGNDIFNPFVHPPSVDLLNHQQELSHTNQIYQGMTFNYPDKSKQGTVPKILSAMQIPIAENGQAPIYYRLQPSDSGETVDKVNGGQSAVEQEKAVNITAVIESKKRRKKKSKQVLVLPTNKELNPVTLAMEIDLENKQEEIRPKQHLKKPEVHQGNLFQSITVQKDTVNSENECKSAVEQEKDGGVTPVIKCKKKGKNKKKQVLVVPTNEELNPVTLAVEIDLENKQEEIRPEQHLKKPEVHQGNLFQSIPVQKDTDISENECISTVVQGKAGGVTPVIKSKKKAKNKKKQVLVVPTNEELNPVTLAVEIKLENNQEETRPEHHLRKPEVHEGNVFQSIPVQKETVISEVKCERKSKKGEELVLPASTNKIINSDWVDIKPLRSPCPSLKLEPDENIDHPLQENDESVPSKTLSGLTLNEKQIGLSVSLHKMLTLTSQDKPILVTATDMVPMNFGIELLDSAVHNNIDLLADGGAVIRANSLILSLNSPVLHRMTTSLELQEIDMKEFSEKSVRVFVEAAYTGKLPDIPSEIFRDLHKISHAFQVGWLSESCFAMFTEFSHQIDEIVPLYLEQVYLFEEAAYVLSKLKLVHFRDLAIVRIQSSESGKKVFIKKYLKGLTTLSACHLDMIVLLASYDIDMIVDPLKELLVQQLGVKGTAISDECKYLLNKCDLSPCRRYNSKLFEQLFDVLQDLAVDSSEDMKWVLELHRKSAKNSEEVEKVVMKEKTAKEGNEAKIPTKNKWFWQK